MKVIPLTVCCRQHAICDASWCEPLEERDALKRVQPVKTDTMRLLLSVPQTTQAKHVLDLCAGNLHLLTCLLTYLWCAGNGVQANLMHC